MSAALSPVIKWSGSKRKVAPLISQLFPRASCYIEPFLGGGALLPYRPCARAIGGDIISELIRLWKLIQSDPKKVMEGYRKRWQRLQTEGHTAFYDLRSQFNEGRDPLDLLFLSRTCVNGLIRFNGGGGFNNSLHHTRRGIHPERFEKLLYQWHEVVKGVTFVSADYRETLSRAKRNDLVFLDPPYLGTRGRYLREPLDFKGFCQELDRLNRVGAKWVLTFDGEAGERKYTARLPSSLYTIVAMVKTGHSPFSRLMEGQIDNVIESVYLNFNLPREALAQFFELRPNPAGLMSGRDVKDDALITA